MADTLIFNPIERLIWVFAIFILLFCASLFFYKGKKSLLREERVLLFGLARMFLFFALERIFYFMSDYFIAGNYEGHSYFGVYQVSSEIFFGFNNFGLDIAH